MATGIEDQKLDACCLTEYRPLPGTPQGQIVKIGEINTYHIQGKDQTSKEKAIVLLTDVFGILFSLINKLLYCISNRSDKKSSYYC
jgi:hypothetical protein